MNILFIDPACWEGHIAYNRYWIDMFQKEHISFKAVLKLGYGKSLNLSAENIIWEYTEPTKDTPKHQLLCQIYKHINPRQFDYVVFSVVNKGAFIRSPFFLFTRCILVSHVWSPPSFLYKLFLRILSFRHRLVSIDPFIHQNLLQHRIPNTLVIHPVPRWSAVTSRVTESHLFQVYVPSRNSHTEFTGWIKQDSSFSAWLRQNGIQLHIRDSHTDKQEEIIFSDELMDAQTYQQKIQQADLILIPYDSDFTNRISNVFLEAIALHKNILIKRPTHLDHYQTFDPQGLHLRYFSTLQEFKEQLLYFKTASEVPSHTYQSLIDIFSIENMGEQFCRLIHLRS